MRLQRTNILSRVAAAGLLVSCISCGQPLTATECSELLARYTELLMAQEQRRPSPREVERAKLNVQSAVAREARYEFEACAARIRRSQFECAIQAPDVDALESCLTL